ncbi:hypothetical protein A4X13_0g6627 [Tilletia indica]|uniref:Uncharacterized protein n=1 Tax=Tilletia indica TaxID=43049 RepID=A0A177T2T0_9BASI|nr:hypothetical protein A4X13_0g6627 [Tilletia indica]
MSSKGSSEAFARLVHSRTGRNRGKAKVLWFQSTVSACNDKLAVVIGHCTLHLSLLAWIISCTIIVRVVTVGTHFSIDFGTAVGTCFRTHLTLAIFRITSCDFRSHIFTGINIDFAFDFCAILGTDLGTGVRDALNPIDDPALFLRTFVPAIRFSFPLL